MLYSRDTPFWSRTHNIQRKRKTQAGRGKAENKPNLFVKQQRFGVGEGYSHLAVSLSMELHHLHMLYSRDTPFWSQTHNIQRKRKTQAGRGKAENKPNLFVKQQRFGVGEGYSHLAVSLSMELHHLHMLYSRDTPFWSQTHNIQRKRKTQAGRGKAENKPNLFVKQQGFGVGEGCRHLAVSLSMEFHHLHLCGLLVPVSVCPAAACLPSLCCTWWRIFTGN